MNATITTAIRESILETRTVELQWSEETATALSLECEDHDCEGLYWGPEGTWQVRLIGEEVAS